MALDDKLELCDCTATTTADTTPKPALTHVHVASTDYGEALDRMIDRLSTVEVPSGDNAGSRPLAALTTRAKDDPTIALLDATACMLDVLGFYQEQVTNEAFLGTAAEEESVRLLAREIGYTPAPGVAATTILRFSMDSSGAGPAAATIARGTQVMNAPTDGSSPVVFETLADLAAIAALSAIKPKPKRTFVVETDSEVEDLDTNTLYVYRAAGVGLKLREGMKLVLREGSGSSLTWDVWTITGVEEDATNKETVLQVDRALTWSDGSYPSTTAKVFALKSKFSVFGAAAPEWYSFDADWRTAYLNTHAHSTTGEWPSFTDPFTGTDSNKLELVPENTDVSDGSLVFLAYPGADSVDDDGYQLATVSHVRHYQKARWTLSQRLTRVTLNSVDATQPDWNTTFADRRYITAYGASVRLYPAEVPNEAAIADTRTIELDGLHPTLAARQRLLIYDGTASEVVTVAAVGQDADQENTTIRLKDKVRGSYDRATTTLSANFVSASHGERVEEAIGSGSAAAANQRFKLSGAPLTHLSGAHGAGAVSTLEVRVDGVMWRSVASLRGQSGHAHVYTLDIDADDNVVVEFGDGVNGARLPTGSGNVVARYRKGAGRTGNLAAGGLTVLRSRPVGVVGVINPVPAHGGADGESRANSRRNAPSSTVSIDRLVSLRDYQDFVRSFAGVGRTFIRPLVYHGHHVLHVTILDPHGRAFAAGAPVPRGLAQALRRLGDPHVNVHVQTGRVTPFSVAAKIKVRAGAHAETVLTACQHRLEQRFGLGRLDFGESVSGAHILVALHHVHGVEAVDIDELYTSPHGKRQKGNRSVLTCERGGVRRRDGLLLGAQVLALDSIALTEVHR